MPLYHLNLNWGDLEDHVKHAQQVDRFEALLFGSLAGICYGPHY